MLLEYDYDNGMKVLDLLKKNKIATLSITEQGNTQLIEYTLLNDYEPDIQKRIKTTLTNSVNVRLSTISLLDNFIVSKAEWKDTKIKLYFSALKKPVADLAYWLNGDPLIAESMRDNYSKARKTLERLHKLSIELGIVNVPLGDVYRKEKNGRNKKYIPLTVNDFIQVMRKAIDN